MSTPVPFPKELIRPSAGGANFGASLVYNPLGGIKPVLWYGFGIDLAPMELGARASAPDLFGTEIDTDMELGALVLPRGPWRSLGGRFGPIEDEGESSIYINSTHNPILVLGVELEHKTGRTFRVALDLLIAFEHGGCGYQDCRVGLETEATYTGVEVYVYPWEGCQEVLADWGVPQHPTEASMTAFMGRFADLSGHALEVNDRRYMWRPTEG